ncbi:MAG TPA: von Willebrand factor type A domain-containing protein [Acidobacteriota bacterium]|nr:von Willebrand factor type A domain-containing protein [Acidobacteriota bacterium]
MKDDARDVKLTSYALGELDEQERMAMEAELDSSPSSREAVEEIRRTAALLRDELGKEPPLYLSTKQRANIEASFEKRESPAFSWLRFSLAGGLAAAACLLLVLLSSIEKKQSTGVLVQARLQQPKTKGEASLKEQPEQAADRWALNSRMPAKVLDGREIVGKSPKQPKELAPSTPTVAAEKPRLSASEAEVDLMSPAATRPLEDMKKSEAQSRPAASGPSNQSPLLQRADSESLRRSPTPAGNVLPESQVTIAALPLRKDAATPLLATLAGKTEAASVELSVQGSAIFGVVTDQSGAIIPGAHITITDLKTGTARYAVTDEFGRFEISGLPAGRFRLEVALPGFKKYTQMVSLPDKGKLQANVLLQVGAFSETVSVVAAAPGIQASMSTLGRAERRKMRAVDSIRTSAKPGAALGGRSLPQRKTDLAKNQSEEEKQFNTEAYDHIVDNPFIRVTLDPLSTFSIDVDTASYANLRRFLNMNQKPPKDSVRIEEMINYFPYDYFPPTGEQPFAVHTEVASAPWNPQHRLVRIGLKGREIDLNHRPASNLVFLIDVSGSMQPEERLPLLKRAMRLLVEQLTGKDRVAIVVYAGNSGLVLPSTSCSSREPILRALDNLEAGGSTNGGSGIQLAYDTAVANFIKGGTNRVILATDGDFNVGVTNQGDLTRLIQEKAKSGVFLSVLGFGMGNYKDSTLEKLADKGHGNYAYIDTLSEARKVLVEEMSGTLLTIAKDVKIQVEFNPAEVEAYRLIGYENRIMRHEDFNDDKKDAGDIGAGHTVTALYEIVPKGVPIDVPGVDPLKYQRPMDQTRAAHTGELMTLKLRYKEPEGKTSRLLEIAILDRGVSFEQASPDFQFSAAVASFGMLLRDSPYKGEASLDRILQIANGARGVDRQGYRAELIDLVRKARALGL